MAFKRSVDPPELSLDAFLTNAGINREALDAFLLCRAGERPGVVGVPMGFIIVEKLVELNLPKAKTEMVAHRAAYYSIDLRNRLFPLIDVKSPSRLTLLYDILVATSSLSLCSTANPFYRLVLLQFHPQ